MSVNPYKRELQVAKNLVTLRWASIPIIFAFCYYAFNYSFNSSLQARLEPIYIICCILAIFNIYLTLHISMLSQQLSVTKGLATLKRLLLRDISQFLGSFKTKGLKALIGIPKIISKVIGIIYLMMLETAKDFTFNPMSLDNVMHFQIFFDIIVILLLTRYTGSTESPLFYMSAIPITVAGSVISAKAGIVYSLIACGGWLINSLLIKFGIISHFKFFSPDYGDLRQCNIWIGSYSLVGVFVLTTSAFISQKLSDIYKEKITDLDKALKLSKSMGTSLKKIALIQNDPWISLDKEGKIVYAYSSKNLCLESEDILEKNILEILPSLKETDYESTVQSVLESKKTNIVSNVKLVLKDNTEHIYDITISFFKEYNYDARIIALFKEKTQEINQINLVNSLSQECKQSKESIEKYTIENNHLKESIEDLSKQSSDKSSEIDNLSCKINEITQKSNDQIKRIDELTNKVVSTKSYNDKLKKELKNKQAILEDIADFIDSCSELDKLISKLEKRTKSLFGLENICFHVFDATNKLDQKNEILDMNEVSPRLLDIPRKHPETLDPALTEGRPVVFSAEFRPENSSTSLAITNGNLKRLVAFVPVKEEDKILGIMMLEKYGNIDNDENIVDMVSFYLKHVSGAIKNAIKNQKINYKNKKLHENILILHNRIDTVKSMLSKDYSKEPKPLGSMLFDISKVVALKDAMIAKVQSDGTVNCLVRLNRSKELEFNELEIKLINEVKKNIYKKIEFNSENGENTILIYPLSDRNRLLGILFLFLSENREQLDSVTMNFCVNVLKQEYIIYELNAEREVWESFYGESISA